MARISVFDTFPFILLFWLIVRTIAENAEYYNREVDIFVNHGLRNVTTASDIQCCVTCMLDDICESVSYNDADRICQVNDKNPDTDETATATSSEGWTSFYPKRQHVCRSGWHFYSGSCYHLVTSYQNWASSESHCQTLGGHLADFQNADEIQFVRNLTVRGQAYWIGLNDQDEEGTFVWSSSAPYQFQPSMSSNSADDDCVLIITQHCTSYGDTFRVFANTSLNGFNTGFADYLTPSECQQQCVLVTEFVCRTMEYSTVGTRCHFCYETGYTHPSSLDTTSESIDWFLAQRNCA